MLESEISRDLGCIMAGAGDARARRAVGAGLLPHVRSRVVGVQRAGRCGEICGGDMGR